MYQLIWDALDRQFNPRSWELKTTLVIGQKNLRKKVLANKERLSKIDSSIKELTAEHKAITLKIDSDVAARVKKSIDNSKVLMHRIMTVVQKIEKRAAQTRLAVINPQKIRLAQTDLQTLNDEYDTIKTKSQDLSFLADELHYKYENKVKSAFQVPKAEPERRKNELAIKDMLRIVTAFNRSLAEAQEDILASEKELETIKKWGSGKFGKRG